LAAVTARAEPRPGLARRFEASILLWAAAAGVLGFLVLVPLAWLFYASLQARGTGELTVANYVEVFSRRIYLQPIVSSLELALAVALIAMVVGAVIAWLVARSDMPGRGLMRSLILGAFTTPPFLGAVAWIFLAAPNSGWLNKAWVAMTGAPRGPISIFSFGGAIFVMAIYSVPYTFTFVSGALELMSSEIEDAAASLGAGAWRTTFQVTLPLAMPAVVSGFIMSFLEALALFGVPAFLLIPARQPVVTTQLYLFFQNPLRVELAAAYAMPLLLVTMAFLYLQRRLIGRKRFTTITGKGGLKRLVKLGRWRWPALGLCLLLPLLSIALPYGALLATSLSRAWGKGPVPGNLTLYWYQWALFVNKPTQVAISHSLWYSAAAATIAMIVAVLVAYVVQRKLLPAAEVLGFVAMAPFVVPGIVLAIGFFSAYAHPPILLYGTAGILIAAFATRFLPIAYSNASSIIRAVNPELENAARTLGCGRLGSLWEVTLPLLKRGILAGWLLVFIPALRELSSAVFLFTPRTTVMTTVIFDLSDAGNYEAVSTLGIVMMLFTFTVVVVAYRVFGRDFTVQRQAA